MLHTVSGCSISNDKLLPFNPLTFSLTLLFSSHYLYSLFDMYLYRHCWLSMRRSNVVDVSLLSKLIDSWMQYNTFADCVIRSMLMIIECAKKSQSEWKTRIKHPMYVGVPNIFLNEMCVCRMYRVRNSTQNLQRKFRSKTGYIVVRISSPFYSDCPRFF